MRDDQLGHEVGSSVIEVLLRAAVAEALRTEQPEAFLAWMRENAPPLLMEWLGETNQDALLALSMQFGHGIWNAVPLPSNGFRPRPLPKPKRNDLCICGSGLKYKHCCASGPQLPPFEAEGMWSYLVELLPQKTLLKAIADRHIPAWALVDLALANLAEGDAETAVAWLEPYFSHDLKQLNYRHGLVLNALCDAYDALGSLDVKLVLLERVSKQASGEVASDAAQRLATIALDKFDYPTARQHFQQAMRLNSNDPMLSVLELQLLLGEGNVDLARRRAGFWLHRLQRGPDEPPLELLTVLKDAQDDPAQALSELFVPMLGDALEELLDWIGEMQQRPVSPYRLLPLEGFDSELGGQNPHALDTPGELLRLEEHWYAVFPSLGDEEGVDPLQPGVAEPWLAFLRAHPEAADSLEILGNLLALLLGEGLDKQTWLAARSLAPILNRGKAIIEASLATVDEGASLPGLFVENRTALNLLVERIGELQGQDLIEELNWLLRLDPNDNYGLRSLLMNLLLQIGDDTEALALAARYSDDASPEILYGRALALHRLKDREAARQAMDLALNVLPTVAAFLTGRRRAKPKQDHPGFHILGSDSEAYAYAAQMRSVWQDSPGALDLVRRRVRARK